MRRTAIAGIGLVLICARLALPADGDERLRVERVATGLDNPCSVAVHPVTGELFVAESGAGRIVRIKASEPYTITTVIEGFPTAQFGDGPSYQIGPLGLAFVDRSTLVVGEGGQAAGADVVRIYVLPDEPKVLKHTESKHSLGPIPAGVESMTGEGDFYALAVTAGALFVAGHGDDLKGWIFRADLANLPAPQLKPFIKTKVETKTDAPTALAISKRGELLVAHMGELDKPRDSRISFFQSASGKKLLDLETGLHDITGLAYEPTSGWLFAVDFAWSDPEAGGLYRLDMTLRGGRQAIHSVKLRSLVHPTALAIPSQGVAYVTTLGAEADPSAAAAEKAGQLLKISGDFGFAGSKE
jgi:DNA-binding beta-propeller fold protein YncE